MKTTEVQTKKSSTRDYFGFAYADKCYRGKKNVNLVFAPASASLLAERLLRAVNAGKKKIDVAIYATDNGIMESGERARITVTSRKKNAL